MLTRRVRAFIGRHRLIEPGETVLVAVSGGADSLCLLLILHELAPMLGVRLHVAHLDHQFRPDAAADAAFVAQVARQLDLPATVEARDVNAVRRTAGLSLEAAARLVRYTFLRAVAEEIGASRAAVGHTADDQAETVLLHLIRGAGLAGLRGIAPLTCLRLAGFPAPLTVVRPLLDVERAACERYCRERGYEPRRDPTNWSPEFLRNRVRGELIPLLERAYNPGIRRLLVRTARAAADDFAHLTAEVDRIWPEVARERPGRIDLAIAGVQALSRSLQRHLLRRAFAALVDAEAELGAEHVERLLAVLERPHTGKRLELPGQVTFAVDYETATLERAAAAGAGPASPLPELAEGELTVPGPTLLGAWVVRARLLDAGPTARPAGSGRWSARLDFERLGPSLSVRRRQPGDRFCPLGLGAPKRLQDFFVDAKVPRAWRDRVPIVDSPRGIAWVVGWRIDDRFKVTPATRTILELEFRRDDDADRSN